MKGMESYYIITEQYPKRNGIIPLLLSDTPIHVSPDKTVKRQGICIILPKLENIRVEFRFLSLERTSDPWRSEINFNICHCCTRPSFKVRVHLNLGYKHEIPVQYPSVHSKKQNFLHTNALICRFHDSHSLLFQRKRLKM